HVSRGRAGLNIVCGWNQEEFDMFGHRQSEHDTRYEQGREWYTILSKIFSSAVPFDHRGKFYELKQVTGAPPPVQQPRPVTLSAAFSPAVRRFAPATSDFLFTTLPILETVKPHIAEIRRLAAEATRCCRQGDGWTLAQTAANETAMFATLGASGGGGARGPC